MAFERLVQDLFGYCRSHDIDDLYFNVKPFWNVFTELHKMSDLEPYWDDEMVLSAVRNVLKSYNGNFPSKVNSSICQSLIDSIKQYLSINCDDHVLVLPIENALLSQRIQFGDFMFIPNDMDRNVKVEMIGDFVGLLFEETNWFAEHTEKSRSPHFFMHALLCMKIRHQTNVIHFTSENRMRLCVYILRALYYAYVKGSSDDRKYPWVRKFMSRSDMEEYRNSHLAIYAKENWRRGHNPIRFSSECKFSLDWLSIPSFQKKYLELCDTIILSKVHDEFSHRFINSLRFLNKAIELQYHSDPLEQSGLRLLFLMIAAECILLPGGENEKRLRLSALLPRISEIEGYSISELSRIVDQVYRWRNDYVHSGNDIFIDRHDEHDRNFEHLTLKMVAKVIADYPRYLRFVENQYQSGVDKTRINIWKDYLHEVFDRVIFGIHVADVQ
ncbi:MAG: hypothetical protein K6T63_11450 [Alicyclobacillus herbarius]|uniref:HEPN domain-containing protein n=1 Tax=Alicyclobacillus herbarius TaxID=122960 RepID=UPI0023531975|nr:HEPN domain-containing protein [Alicyclobacillus herbarius]MCL6633232.1 hypothetical protein [Alicyclobacillus herbarius]